jgi:hypothetical protein
MMREEGLNKVKVAEYEMVKEDQGHSYKSLGSEVQLLGVYR